MVHNAFASKIHQLKKIKTKLLKGNKKILKKREKDLGFNFFFFFYKWCVFAICFVNLGIH